MSVRSLLAVTAVLTIAAAFPVVQPVAGQEPYFKARVDFAW